MKTDTKPNYLNESQETPEIDLLWYSEIQNANSTTEGVNWRTIASAVVAKARSLERERDDLRYNYELVKAALELFQKEYMDVPLCADHAQTWFTARHFKPGDCWFCQADEKMETLKKALQAILVKADKRQANGGDLFDFQDSLRESADVARLALKD